MMRKYLLLTAMAGLVAMPVAAAPIDAAGALGTALREATPGATLVWWHAGGTTGWGNHWHAGGTGAYGAHPAYGYHGWGGDYHTYYRPPVVVTPGYNPAGSFAAGAIVGGVVGAAAASASRPPAPPAATTVYNYSQPPTVVNNYYSD
ncbi:hypothetical protein GXW78_09495 [Roseomonas terrae]|jgi:hypothetical protein|uniref:Uncharacterized protein n=1 Tax=Neoroseomonas terrae TaxID=424799 RepID=A0ABS5EFV1_9PROT|nr:hypothetical protein [Neoroseomonas terrae]MBR0649897.1 hypothetical protein [Neoroseomonas terrae]